MGPEHTEGADWRQTVPSYTQPGSGMDTGAWDMQPRDESQEPLPKNWEMAYTESGMVYFIEWVRLSDIIAIIGIMNYVD